MVRITLEFDGPISAVATKKGRELGTLTVVEGRPFILARPDAKVRLVSVEKIKKEK